MLRLKKALIRWFISFDIYSRTTSKVHHETAAGSLKNYTTKMHLKKKKLNNYYDEAAKTFLADRYTHGNLSDLW
ncbi:MAG: class I tRNA ligase family protein [Puia sp.]